MIERISSLFSASSADSPRSYIKPIIVVIALCALARLVFYIVKSLDDRVQDVSDFKKLYSEGLLVCEEERYDEAIAKFDLALSTATDPRWQAKILVARGDCYFKTSEFERALRSYTLAVSAEGFDMNFKALLLLKKGHTQWTLGQNDEAIQTLKEAEGLHTSAQYVEAQILFFCALAYISKGQFEAALKYLIRADSVNHDIERVSKNIVESKRVIFSLIEEYSKTVLEYSQQLENVSQSPNERALILYRRGCAYRDENKTKLALNDFLTAHELDPNVHPDIEANCFWMQGVRHAEKKEFIVAMRSLKSSITKQPIKNLDRIYYSLGCVYLSLGVFEKAAEAFTGALEGVCVGEALAQLLFYRGWCYAKSKKMDLALWDWAQASKCQFSNEDLLNQIQSQLKLAEKQFPFEYGQEFSPKNVH